MKIKKITISGYRSINETLELELGNINALVGANNVGKTNLLNAIWSVLGRDWVTVNNFDETDVYLHDPDRDIEIVVEFDQPYQYSQYKGIDPIEIPKISFTYTRYKIGANAGQRRLEKKCLNKKNTPVNVLAEKPKKGQQRKYQPLTTIPQEIQQSIPVIYIRSNRELRYQLPSSRNSLLGSLLEDINEDFSNPENKMLIADEDGNKKEVSRIDRFSQCINEAIKSLKTNEFIKLEKTIRDNALLQLGIDPEDDTQSINVFFNPLTSLEFYKSLNLYIEENGFTVNAIDVGGGFQNALVIAILKAFEERKKSGAIFLIEEPEMFLHPQMQRSLYKTIRKIGEENQVIYTSHSPHFVTIPEYDEIIIVRKNDSGTIKKKSNLQTSPELENKLTKELDPERNELFFAQRVLIVEGDTEKLSLPEYAKREDLDFDSVGGTIIEVGGKRNLKAFADLLLSFDIPLGIVYDSDSSDFKDKNDEEEYNESFNTYIEKGAKVWCFNKNYEDELKSFFGEQEYQELCQKYSGVTKTIRARLIALDSEYEIPNFIKPIIYWLSNKFYEND